ncbi:MAG: ATPase, partial [Fusobacteriaceae bacterium]
MIKDLSCSIHVKKNIINELSINKTSGTYILYGNDKNRLYEVALSFGKSLNCQIKENDFCGQCESCIRMEKGSHGDLEVIAGENGIKIDSIRALIYKASTTAYEGKNKIFILKDIENMKLPASNALLKTIEETQKGNFFFLLTTSLNILSTIKSRSTIIKITEIKREELGVSIEEYEFFNRKAKEILEYKERNLNLESSVDYINIGKFMKDYFLDKSLENKINIYKSL